MTTEVNANSLSNAVSYLFFGNGEDQPPEPFCEAELISPYPFKSLSQARAQLDNPTRIEKMQYVAENALNALWQVDGVVSVKGLSSDVIEKNCAIWSKRKSVASFSYWTGLILSSLAAAAGAIVYFSKQSVIARDTLPAIAIGIGVAFVAGACFWYLGSKRWTSANEAFIKSEMPACNHIANKRAEILQKGNLHEAIESRGSYGITSAERVITPEECEWLWIEAVQKECANFALEAPTAFSAGSLVSNFASSSPFDVIDEALFQPYEKVEPRLIDDIEPIREVFSCLAAKVRSIQEIYNGRAAVIQANAKENRALIRSRKSLALNAVTSMYWTKVYAEKNARDEKLARYKPNLSGLTPDQADIARREYRRHPEVIKINKAYDRKIKEYANYRTLAQAAIESYFNPQLKKEDRNEAADLKANNNVRLSHLSLFYPAVRSLYNWTGKTIKAERGAPLPEVPSITDPRMPELLTAQKPAEPSNNDVLCWSSIGQNLDLPSLVMGAGSLWAIYQNRQSEYEEIARDHQDDRADYLPSYAEATEQ